MRRWHQQFSMSQAQPPKENTLLFWMAAPKLDFNRTNRSSNHYKKVTSHFWTRDLTYHPKAFEILQANTLGHLILQSTNQANTLGELTHSSSRTNTITLPNPDTNWQSSPFNRCRKEIRKGWRWKNQIPSCFDSGHTSANSARNGQLRRRHVGGNTEHHKVTLYRFLSFELESRDQQMIDIRVL